jgi:hypothetical protein
LDASVALARVAALPAFWAGAQNYDLQLLGTKGDVEAIGRTGDVPLIIDGGDACEFDEAAVCRDGQVNFLACNATAFGVNAGDDVVGNGAGGGNLWTRSGSEVDIVAPQPIRRQRSGATSDAGRLRMPRGISARMCNSRREMP